MKIEELKKIIEKALDQLYLIEDFYDYEDKKIGECINRLQDINKDLSKKLDS